MSKPAYKIKRHDTAIVIQYQSKQASNGKPKSLAGHTATFSMRVKGGALKVTNETASIPDAANGHLDYNLVAADVDTSGEFEGAFEVTHTASGNKFTVPGTGYIDIIIEDDINNV
jgi:hypothetical protein